jgi:Mn2+/Fe2+ NRAMP family transporter
VLLLLIPVLIVNQEMVVRLGVVTGVGHGKMIFERFGRFWGAFSVGDLFLLTFLTLVTEFIGVSLALGHFGVSPYLSVPIAPVTLVVFTVSGSFRRWERFMFVFIVANFLVIPLVLLSNPALGPVAHDFVVPGVKGGPSSNAVLLIIAIVGTTVAPWQLFFQQSNIVDKRITPRWIAYERLRRPPMRRDRRSWRPSAMTTSWRPTSSRSWTTSTKSSSFVTGATPTLRCCWRTSARMMPPTC